MKIKVLKWVIIGLIFIAALINYVDRSALTIMWRNENEDGLISHSDKIQLFDEQEEKITTKIEIH